eukprot:9475919-Prorocentrum_lima.AAC.1
MTSSLVGSEMCIRDRGQGNKGKSRGEKQRGKVQWTREEQRKDKETTVSYTHLTLPTICSV